MLLQEMRYVVSLGDRLLHLLLQLHLVDDLTVSDNNSA